jgi:hypothetical protein
MITMNAAELATWTPVALDLEASTPWIEWGNFGTLRFTEPFFDETVSLWAAGDPPPRLVRTALDVLVVLDQAPSLEPSGLIFHLSRCGSTLLTRLLRQIPGSIVISESELLNRVLLASPELADEDTRVRLVRLLIRAFGRRRLGDERHYVLKLSGWHVRFVSLFRRAFPETPFLWLQRRPADVIMSLLAARPYWLSDETTSIVEPAETCARVLEALFNEALQARSEFDLTIDYADLPDAAWTVVAPLFRMTPSTSDIGRMRAEARYDAKISVPTDFARDRRAIPEVVQQLAAQALNPVYQKLAEQATRVGRPCLPR